MDGKEKSKVYLIRFVEPGGILAKAGFVSGDIPVGYKHGFESGFYLDLIASRSGETMSMQVLNINEARKGNWKWRDVKLRYKK